MKPSRIVIALILIALGVVFLLDQTGAIADAGETIGDWWPVAIIALGLVMALERPGSFFAPVLVTGVGVILLLVSLDVVEGNVWNYVWPAVLVLIGLAILLRRPGRAAPKGSGDQVVRIAAVFSGHEEANHSLAFRGGAVTAVFGGATLDLRSAKLDPEGASLSVTACFGGADILVPRGWRVSTTGLPIFGGVDNKVEPVAEAAPDSPLLRVDVLAIFGGCDIKHEKQG